MKKEAEIRTKEYQSGFKYGLIFTCKILSGHANEIIKDYEDVYEMFLIKGVDK